MNKSERNLKERIKEKEIYMKEYLMKKDKKKKLYIYICMFLYITFIYTLLYKNKRRN